MPYSVYVYVEAMSTSNTLMKFDRNIRRLMGIV